MGSCGHVCPCVGHRVVLAASPQRPCSPTTSSQTVCVQEGVATTCTDGLAFGVTVNSAEHFGHCAPGKVSGCGSCLRSGLQQASWHEEEWQPPGGWRREGRGLQVSSYRAATTDLMSSEGTAISTDGPRPAPALPSKMFAHPGHPQGLSLTTRELWVRARGRKCPSIPSWARALPVCHLGNLCSLPPRRVWGNLGKGGCTVSGWW